MNGDEPFKGGLIIILPPSLQVGLVDVTVIKGPIYPPGNGVCVGVGVGVGLIGTPPEQQSAQLKYVPEFAVVTAGNVVLGNNEDIE